MRRPAVRFVLTLVAAASILGVVPATSEAGIIPWAWDTMFGPVGSIQARRATYYNGGYSDGGCCDSYSAGAYYGPARPMFVGFRGWRRNNACCGTYGYANYGYADAGCGCSTGCNTCNTGCSSCGVGYDGGYIQGCGPGGCASGQCNVNYGSASGGTSPVTPATPGAPSPGYDTGAGPMPPAGTNNVVPPPAPGPETNDGFVPRGKTPAPGTNDPTKDEEFVPPKVNNPDGTNAGVDASGNSTTIPPVEPNPAIPAKKRPALNEDDEKGTGVGPRLELEEKVTWHRSFVRTRQAQAPVRVTASANRSGMFPKIAWRSTVETELAKK